VTDAAPEITDREMPSFAHASEAEMARILDFYDVRWEYEPTTFPILWNLEGEVVESFSPDFYLPELDMFLEMTTLKQRLVRKKNRKLRRLKELYPDIRIKLFYARDFAAMMLKYGRFALVESLSGTVGQMVHDRSILSAPIIAGLPDAIAAAPHALAPESAVVPPPVVLASANAGEPPAHRSRTAARRLRRRHQRAAASGTGVATGATVGNDEPHREATRE